MRLHVVSAFVLSATAVGAAAVQQTQSVPTEPPPFGPPSGWPGLHRPVTPVPTPVPGTPGPLPSPSITEPFAIGEALHDPARVADAIVSVLPLMGIEIIPDDPAQVVFGGPRVQLQESEVRALIEIGRADVQAWAGDPSAGQTFNELHRRVRSLLPDVSVEDLAAGFTAEFERTPDSVVAQLLMGQPLEPETPLLETQIWLLLADRAVALRARSVATRMGPRIVPVQSAPTLSWSVTNGSAIDAALRMPLILSAALEVAPVQGHEGHGGSGRPFTAEGRARGRAIVFTGTSPRPPMLAAPSSLAGMAVEWATDDAVRRHTNAPASRQATVGAGGVASLTMTPRAEAARGRGEEMSEPGAVTLTADMFELCERLYPSSPSGTGLCEVTQGRKVSSQGVATLEWHDDDVIDVTITNTYDVGSRLAGLTRNGEDFATIKLAREEDGTYHGGGILMVFSRTRMPGESCGISLSWQAATVVGVPIAKDVASARSGQVSGVPPKGGGPATLALSMGAAFYTPVHLPTHYTLKQAGQADAQLPDQPLYLRLEFFPVTAPAYARQDGCHDEIPGPTSRATPNFIPLNDAQWTIEGFHGSGGDPNRAGYSIAVPAEGTLRYEDLTSNSPTTVGSFNFGNLLEAQSIWYITIERRKSTP